MLDVLENTPHQAADLMDNLKGPVLFYLILRVSINLINRIHDYISLKVLPMFNKKIVIKLTKYIQNHSHSYFQSHFGGSIVSKISIIADTSESIVNSLIYHFVFPIFTLLVAAWAMGMISPLLTFILSVWALLFVMLSYRLSLQVNVLSKELSEKYTTLVGKLIDSITNILTVRLFAREKYEVTCLKLTAQEKATKAQELRWNDLKRQAVMELMASILVAFLIYFLIRQRQKGEVTIGDFALVLTLSLNIIDIVWDMARNYIRFIEELGRCAQALKTLMVPHAIKDDPFAVPLIVQKGKIEYKNVTFSHENDQPFIKNLSITIYEGEKVGIVGFSGSGKTTFINLIARLHDVQKGKILIDNQDIQKVSQESLHQNISFLPQDPMLFHRPLIDNIRYGNLEASYEDVIKAAQMAHAHEFIIKLPNGYHTIVGERGSKLSGGQRQRIAIARAILKNAKILILDEATSALDSLTEYYIQQSLEQLMQGKTVLVIAHRLSTLQKMDRLLVFHEGNIIEDGDHKTLLQKGGTYAHFWTMQTQKAVA